MSDELKQYNHLKYEEKDTASEQDGFVDFLFQHSDINCPEVNTDKAWDQLAQRMATDKSKKQAVWLKIAASIAIIATTAFSVYFFNVDPDQIQVASGAEKVLVTFPDGSTGFLNAASEFSYPEKFGLSRDVEFSGEAYFDIKKSKKPFVINANGVDVKVLGTAFNLVTSENEVHLYVDRGLVAFEKDGEETPVEAGKQAVFDKVTNTVSIKDVPDANIMSWRNGTFKFEDTPFGEVLNELSGYYEVEFKLANKNLKSCRVSASINGRSLEEVLLLLESILDVKTKLKDNTVKISGKGC